MATKRRYLNLEEAVAAVLDSEWEYEEGDLILEEFSSDDDDTVVDPVTGTATASVSVSDSTTTEPTASNSYIRSGDCVLGSADQSSDSNNEHQLDTESEGDDDSDDDPSHVPTRRDRSRSPLPLARGGHARGQDTTVSKFFIVLLLVIEGTALP